MSETKYTPGPWYLSTEDGRDDRITGSLSRTGTPWIAEVIDGLPPGMARANAHLIAAAPDLLAALEALSSNPCINLGDLIYQVREREGKGWDGPAVTAWGEAVEKAKAAINKAKGEL
jgi:hypothetical protein